jgi:hypothetical protein
LCKSEICYIFAQLTENYRVQKSYISTAQLVGATNILWQVAMFLVIGWNYTRRARVSLFQFLMSGHPRIQMRAFKYTFPNIFVLKLISLGEVYMCCTSTDSQSAINHQFSSERRCYIKPLLIVDVESGPKRMTTANW